MASAPGAVPQSHLMPSTPSPSSGSPSAVVAAHEPPRRLIIESLGSPQFRGGWELHPAGERTRATYLTARALPRLARTLKPLVAPSFAAQLNRSMARLNQLLNPQKGG